VQAMAPPGVFGKAAGTVVALAQRTGAATSEDGWHGNYDGAPTDGSALAPGRRSKLPCRPRRFWRNESELVRAAVRVRRNANVRFDTLGS
jgi:hypothetical protein